MGCLLCSMRFPFSFPEFFLSGVFMALALICFPFLVFLFVCLPSHDGLPSQSTPISSLPQMRQR